VAFAILYINYLRDKRKAESGDEKTWRQARLDAEKVLRESLIEFKQAVTLDKLKTEADLAAIASIVHRLAEVSEKLIGLSEQMKFFGKTQDRHEEEFKRVHEALTGVQEDIKQLLRDGN
jgi:hypothetical protein